MNLYEVLNEALADVRVGIEHAGCEPTDDLVMGALKMVLCFKASQQSYDAWMTEMVKRVSDGCIEQAILDRSVSIKQPY